MSRMIYIIIGIIVLLIIIGVVVMQRNANNQPLVEEEQISINEETSQSTLTDEIPGTTSVTSPQPESTTSQTESLTVTYTDSGFSPATLRIKKGDTVTFVNSGSGSMWVASDPHPTHTKLAGFDAKKASDSYSFTFTQAGTWTYHNHLTPNDTGTIVVE